MSSQNAITSYESAIENIEKHLKVLKNKSSEDAVGEEIADKVSIKDDELKANILKINEIETSDEETGTPIRTEKDDNAAKVPVIMKLEHIDHQTLSGVNMNLLPSTQQFPVVTRRFRQVPNQSSKEDIAEEYAKGVLEDTAKAQVIIDPTTSEKEPELSAKITKRTAEDNDNVCDAEMDVAIISHEDFTT